jgi:hypothetical protein
VKGKDMKNTEWTFNVGDRVKRLADPYSGISSRREDKRGFVSKRYSKEAYGIGNLTLGPYPELYAVIFDDGSIGNAFLPHGLIKIGIGDVDDVYN